MTNHELLSLASDELRLAQASLGGAQQSRDHRTTCICLDAFNSHIADARSYVGRIVHQICPESPPVAGPQVGGQPT